MKKNNRTSRLAVCLTFLLATGCSASPEEFNKASKACESHGGLEYYYVFPWEQVHCADGTVIKTLGG